MFRKVEDFLSAWSDDSAMTKKYMDILTDESLAQSVAEGHRTLGRMAWHLAQTIPEMLSKTGLTPKGPAEEAPVPASASAIAEAYREASASLVEQVRASFPRTLLLAREVVAWGDTAEVLTQENLAKSRQMAFDSHADVCARDESLEREAV